MTISSYISICGINLITAFCCGFGRNCEHIFKLKNATTAAAWIIENLKAIRSRLNILHLEIFGEFYSHKIKNVIFILKKANQK